MNLVIKLLLSFILAAANYSPLKAFWGSSTCLEQEWTKELGRTQGGGWIWFPGRARDQSKENALIRAEGAALRALIQECQIPHLEAKIHERCLEEIQGIHHAYVRISLRDLECDAAKRSTAEMREKITNQEMLKTYQKYLEIEGLSDHQSDQCYKSKDCRQLGTYHALRDDFFKAFNLFKKGCELNDDSSCFNAGLMALELNNPQEARTFFNLQCRKNDLPSCHFLAFTFEGPEQENAFEKNCQRGHAPSCLEYGIKLIETKRQAAAIPYLDQACDKGDAQICQRVSTIYFEQDLINKSSKAAAQACRLGLGKACFNLSQMEKNADIKQKSQWLTQACKHKIAQACRLLAMESTDKVREKFLVEACDLGDAQSCQMISVVYFDQNAIDQSLRYSKFACKLGEFKACHNTGLLEQKRGNRDEAKTFFQTSCNQGLKMSCQALTQIQ